MYYLLCTMTCRPECHACMIHFLSLGCRCLKVNCLPIRTALPSQVTHKGPPLSPWIYNQKMYNPPIQQSNLKWHLFFKLEKCTELKVMFNLHSFCFTKFITDYRFSLLVPDKHPPRQLFHLHQQPALTVVL